MPANQSHSQISSQFWMIFGKYMAPILSAEGEKINWINYKTGVKHLRFNLQVLKNSVTIAIEFNTTDEAALQHQFEILEKFKKQFQTICGKEWLWQKMVVSTDDKKNSRVFKTLGDVSILNQSQWPEIISFFKSNLILLDAFWCNYKFAFE